MLTSKYLKGIPEGSRATQGKSLKSEFLTEETLNAIRALNAMAEQRGQTLAQMALAWVLRKGRLTTALIGASRAEQVRDCAAVVKNMDFTEAELQEIDATTVEGKVNLWAASSEREGPSR
jgi:L-glyceraldehyde 3-phosphate reductase